MKDLEIYFERDGYEKIYLKSIKDCKSNLEEYIQKNTPLFNFTDHGIDHSDRINTRLTQLFEGMLSNSNPKIKLNNSELYSLILAIYLHDVGMELVNKKRILELFKEKVYKNKFLSYLSEKISLDDVEKLDENSTQFYDFIRKNHHIVSAMWIMQNNTVEGTLKLPIREEYLKTIALICFAHNEPLEILKEEFYKNTKADGNIMQVNVLAYMLRVGDALDADKNRCDIKILELKDISVASKIHWYRHFYTNSIVCESKNVIIEFEFPEGDEWSDDIEQYFIEESIFWIKNNSDEIIISKIFEDNVRNNYLKYSVEKEVDYGIKKQLDKETKNEIINIISKKKSL